MKNKFCFLIFLTTLAGCNNAVKTTKNDANDSNEVSKSVALLTEEETCFLYTFGDKSQDSTFVSLILKGDSVSGFMHWQPWEKDGAYGTITAVKSADKISGVYVYTIEGLDQSQEIIFKILDGKLHQGEGELKENFGENIMLVFKDTSSIIYETEYKVIDCQLFKKY